MMLERLKEMLEELEGDITLSISDADKIECEAREEGQLSFEQEELLLEAQGLLERARANVRKIKSSK